MTDSIRKNLTSCDTPYDPGLFLRTLGGEVNAIPPLWLMRQAGRYLPEYRAVREKAGSFLELCYTPDYAVDVTLQPVRRFGFDAAILFSDILVVPHGLGQEVTFISGEGPKLSPVVTPHTDIKYNPEKFLRQTAPVYETVRRLRCELPTSTALIGFAGAPWTVATYMVEGGGSKNFESVKRFAYEAPDKFQNLIHTLVQSTTDYLLHQIEHGADTLQIFDSWAGVLAEDQFRRWVIQPTQNIIAAIRQKYPEVPIIGFPKGAGVLYTEYIEQTGVNAVGLDSAVPLNWARENLNTVVLQGNLDPMCLLAGGRALEDNVRHITQSLAGVPYIFNLGHGIHKDTPVAHVERLVDLVRRGAS